MAKTQGLTLDLSEAGKPKTYIPEGTYPAMIANATEDKTRSGDAAVRFEFVLTSDEFDGEKVDKLAPIEGKGAGFTRDILLAFHDEDELVDGFVVNPKNYRGRECLVAVTERFYQHLQANPNAEGKPYCNKSEDPRFHENGDLTSIKFRALQVDKVYAPDNADGLADAERTAAVVAESAAATASGTDEEVPF